MKNLTDEVKDPALAAFLDDLRAACRRHGGSINGEFAVWTPRPDQVTSLGLEDVAEVSGEGVTLWTASRGEVIEDADGKIRMKERA